MRKILITLFSLAACSTAFFAYMAATPPKQEHPKVEPVAVAAPLPPEKMVGVHVARTNIPAGTFIGPKHLRKTSVKATSDAALNGFTKTEELIGAISASPINAGQLMEPAFVLGTTDPGFMAAAIRPGFRGVSVPVWREGTSTMVYRPGDIVDVVLVATFPDRNGGKPYDEVNGKRTPIMLKDVSSIILSNDARILAVSDSKDMVPNPDQKKAFSETIPMILEIADSEAERVAMAAGMGKIYLLMQGDGSELLAVSEEPLTAEELFPEYNSPGPTRGTVLIRGDKRVVEGYKEDQSDSDNSNDKGSNKGENNG